jgi:hypothetical protein
MVFHVSNYMRETNVWMIRKCRWIFWSLFFAVPIYRNTYWDYLGRRQAWYEYLKGESEAERIAKAESLRADWGYRPRYDAKYDFSIKTAKYAAQTREESLRDMPRLHVQAGRMKQEKLVEPKQVRDFIMIVSEHNRQPGVFDYNYPQNFFSTHPEIEYDSFVTIGAEKGKGMRRVHMNEDVDLPQ